MPTYNSLTNRSDAQALMPEEVSREIIKNVPQSSAVLRLARRLPNMTRAQRRMPVLSALMTAYFLNAGASPSDTALKQTTEIAWANKYIDAEELAVICPIPENVLDDSAYDLWGEIRPQLIEALGLAIDQAILYGTGAPNVWPDDILTGATAAANTVVLGTNDDLYDDLLSENGTLATVEVDGFNVTGHIAAMIMKSRLRGLRDANGQPLFLNSMQDRTRYDLDGSPIEFPTNGSMIPASALMFSGDFNQLVFAIRQDITWKVLDQAVIQDGSGAIVYNLAQQDMVALRVTMRLGWQIPNPINRLQPTEANRYPFSILLPS